MLRSQFLPASLSAAAVGAALLAPTAVAQPSHSPNPCDHTEAVAAADATRRVRLDQLGVALEIPANYRAVLLNSGAVEIMDPGTYRLLRCRVLGGDPLGRGASTVTLRPVEIPAGSTLRETLNAALADRVSDADYSVSAERLDGQRGYRVKTPIDTHAEFWVQPDASDDALVIETSCDCSGMGDRLTSVLADMTLLSAS